MKAFDSNRYHVIKKNLYNFNPCFPFPFSLVSIHLIP